MDKFIPYFERFVRQITLETQTKLKMQLKICYFWCKIDVYCVTHVQNKIKIMDKFWLTAMGPLTKT